jgi:hypothetical protein
MFGIIKRFKYFFIALLISILSILLTYYLVTIKKQNDLNETYLNYTTQIHEEIYSLIKDKINTTNSIALSATINLQNIHQLLNGDSTLVQNIDSLSFKLRKYTKFKNVWFQVINTQGISLYRNWSSKKGDSLLEKREDIQKILQTKEISNTISVGKYDMTFKSMVPIFNGEKFIGIFEVITHFNSIAKSLLKHNVSSIVIANKKYKTQLIHPLTNTFIDDYYVANIDAKSYFVEYLRKNNLESIINNTNKYILDSKNNLLIGDYEIPDVNGDNLGNIIFFKPLDDFNLSKLNEQNSYIYSFVIVFTIFILFISLLIEIKVRSKKLMNIASVTSNQLENEKIFLQEILDLNPNIVVVTKDSSIIKANKAFLNFFNFNNLEEFKKQYKCICDFFIDIDSIKLNEKKQINGVDWANYLVRNDNQQKEHKVTVLLNEKQYLYNIQGIYFSDSKQIIVTLTKDIKDSLLTYTEVKFMAFFNLTKHILHPFRLDYTQEFNQLENLTKKGKHESIDFHRSIDTIIDIYKKDLKNYKIETIINIQEELKIEGDGNDFILAISLLIQEYINELSTHKQSNNFIFITATSLGDKIILNIKNNTVFNIEKINYVKTILEKSFSINIESKQIDYEYRDENLKGYITKITFE